MTAPLVTAYTPRLGLVVHAMDDELDAMRLNWDKLDTSYTGVIWVTPGTVPDSKILYEGAIVAERETGKVWRAQKNSNGVFEKKWVKYPWLFYGTTPNNSWPSNPTMSGENTFGCTTPDNANSVNSGTVDAPGYFITLPVDGLYSGVFSCRFESVGNSQTGQRIVGLRVNNVYDPNNYIVFKLPNPNWGSVSDHVLPFNRRFAAGTTLTLDVKQNSGASINVSATFQVALVRPL